MKHQAENHLSWLTIILFAVFSFFHPSVAKAEVAPGTIIGTVRAADTNAVLTSLAVGVYRADDESTRLKAVRTNSVGVFTLTGLSAGNYKIKFFTTGINYVGGWYKKNVSSPASAAATFSEGDIITLTSTSGADTGETQLGVGLQIKGKVTDTSLPNNPISGVYVQAYRNGIWERTSDTATGSTDGSYTISGLRAGDYTIRFWAYQTAYTTEWYLSGTTTNTTPDMSKATPVAAGSSEINAQLSTGGSISGTVKIGTVPVIGALVSVYDSASPYTFRGFTTTSGAVGQEGTYTVRGLPVSGSYVVQFYEKFINNIGSGLTEWYQDTSAVGDAEPLTFPSGSTAIGGIDAILDRGPISGKVTSKTGDLVAGMLINVYDSNQILQFSVTTDAKGQYLTGNLPVGFYKVQFGMANWYNKKNNFSEADGVQAGATNINVELEAPPSLFPIYNILLLKKHCTDAAGIPVYCP